MRLQGWLVVSAVVSVLAGAAADAAAQGQASDGDWKFYGGISSANGQSWCFYDGRSVARVQPGMLRVVAKCLPQDEMDDVNTATAYGGVIARNVSRKRRQHYMPPYALSEALDRSQAADVTRLEEIADIANISPRVRISYELDCARHTARELSLYVQLNGKVVRSVDKPTEWKPISPRENSVRLSRILCRPRAESAPRRGGRRPETAPASAATATG